MKEDTIKEIKKKCGGGEEADFKKNPPTKEEIYECVKRIGCVSLEELAYFRRKTEFRR